MNRQKPPLQEVSVFQGESNRGLEPQGRQRHNITKKPRPPQTAVNQATIKTTSWRPYHRGVSVHEVCAYTPNPDRKHKYALVSHLLTKPPAPPSSPPKETPTQLKGLCTHPQTSTRMHAHCTRTCTWFWYSTG